MKVLARSLVLLLAFGPVAAAQNQLWILQFGTSSADRARGAAPDGSGGVYVSGYTEGSLGGPNAGSEDAWLARHDGAGNQIWIRQLGTSSADRAYAAAPDGSGGVYVSGSTQGSLGGPNAGSYDAWLARYDGAGNQLWIQQLGTTDNDFAYVAAPDGSGGVYVSGSTQGSLGGPNAGSRDPWLAHYDGAGNQIWVVQFGTSRPDATWAAAPDGSGGVYVGGDTRGDLGGPNAGSDDAWLARYDGAGNQLWIQQLGTTGSESVDAAAPDGSGGVYVSGYTAGSLGGPSAGSYDAWLARYDGAGNQIWILQFGTTGVDTVNAAAPDGSGGVYVSGNIEGSLSTFDAWFAHHDGAGNQLWIRQLGTNGDDTARAVAPDGSGGVYVSGYTDGSLGGPSAGSWDSWLARYDDDLGTPYCTPATPNGTGFAGTITATGSGVVIDNAVTLIADQLPPSQFGYFLNSRTQANTFPVPNSQGALCLGGAIGHYNSSVFNTGATGAASLQLDLAQTPTPSGMVAIQMGETWNFTCWYRDNNPGPTSNFTDGVSIAFQ